MPKMISTNRPECDSKVEALQKKLKAVTKSKLLLERQVFKLNNKERALYEELHLLRAEIELLTEELEDLKDKISESSYQITGMEMLKVAEQNKIDTLIAELNSHRKSFENMFVEERKITELRNKEIVAKEAEKQEIDRQRQQDRERQAELQANKAAAIEMEAGAIEQECAVLKKTNHAIMLKLRRKLVLTEDARRELMNQQQERK